jgi:hypothetical protein
LIANPWISLCHSLFYVFHWHSSFSAFMVWKDSLNCDAQLLLQQEESD